MHKRGLISLPSVAEVEEPGSDSPHNNISQQNAAAQDNDNKAGPSNQPGDEPDSGSESEAELLRTVEELRKQVRQKRKAAMQGEKEWLAHELAETKAPTTTSRNAPKQRSAKVKAGSPHRGVNVNNKVKAVRGGGIRRNINKKSPHRETIKSRRTVNDPRALNELSEVADSEWADWGLSDILSDESKPEEDQGMGDITIAYDGNQQKHSVERLADEIESLGRQALLQGNIHFPRPFVNVGSNYMNHASRGYKEFDSWESELTKHKSGIKDRVSEFVIGRRGAGYNIGAKLTSVKRWIGGKVIAVAKNQPSSKGLRMAGSERFFCRRPAKDRKGMITWDRLDLAALELTIMSRAQLQGSNSTAYQGSTGRRWGYRPSASSVGEKVNDFWAEPMPPKGGSSKNKQETFFCSTFQGNLCWYEEPHSGKYNGRMVTRLHICAACWLKDKVRANHPKIILIIQNDSGNKKHNAPGWDCWGLTRSSTGQNRPTT